MGRLAYFVVAAVAAIVFSTAARADRLGHFIVYPDRPDLIALDGLIDSRTVGDFHRALGARPHARIVLLQSPGGDVDIALELAAEIRKRGLSTAIPREFGCYSACSYLFFAGREHVVRGELGVHRVSATGWDEQRSGAVYDGDVRAALRSYGADAGVIRAMVTTPPSKMHVFSRREIAALAINRSRPQSLATKYAEM